MTADQLQRCWGIWFHLVDHNCNVILSHNGKRITALKVEEDHTQLAMVEIVRKHGPDPKHCVAWVQHNAIEVWIQLPDAAIDALFEQAIADS